MEIIIAEVKGGGCEDWKDGNEKANECNEESHEDNEDGNDKAKANESYDQFNEGNEEVQEGLAGPSSILYLPDSCEIAMSIATEHAL